MNRFRGKFQVLPAIPQKLEKLRDLAHNIYWSWNQDTQQLFKRIDRELWDATHHNPVLLLGKVDQKRLEELAGDEGFVASVNKLAGNLTNYLESIPWFQKNYSNLKDFSIVYFSAEFGLTECLQTYSGGLGVLSGDHLKSASDLGLPLTGVGLLYKEGYFQQYLTTDGWQQERYEINDFENLPMKPVFDKDKNPLTLSVSFPGREVFFRVWRIDVGKTPLYLMDTNIPQNSPQDRKITETLYGGNIETRIQQEMILGIGGFRTMLALGKKNFICHMNEGHSAFLSLEKMRYYIQKENLSFNEAKEIGFYSNIFTTHTPVPAGIDVFSNELVEKYFGNYYREELRISDKEFYSLGSITKDRPVSVFNMAHLAMNTSSYINGVSKLHSVVSKKLWTSGFKEIPFNEIPIDYVTNGIHIRSHISREMDELFFQYLGESWAVDSSVKEPWERIEKIPDVELWRTHERRRERLVAFARRRLVKQVKSRGGSEQEIKLAAEVLDPAALTIGFARRFATYKRANLIFRDIERLSDILGNANHPVQIIVAGKAHPKDEEGKRLIQEIVQIANEEAFRRKVVFIENYDMNVARYLVEGCDIWLNNPRRPLEASGTSGMKIIANGGLNFSILDGWWDEAYEPSLGWRIGNAEEYDDTEYQDEVESRMLYQTLEREIVPMFYDRSDDKLPRRWIAKMKSSIKNLTPVFNTNRMVKEYTEKFYFNSYEKLNILKSSGFSAGKKVADWKLMVHNNWSSLKVIEMASSATKKDLVIGDELKVNAKIYLGALAPKDVDVQIYYGPFDEIDDPSRNSFVNMKGSKNGTDGVYDFSGTAICKTTGLQGYTIRILPKHELMVNSHEMGLIFWA